MLFILAVVGLGVLVIAFMSVCSTRSNAESEKTLLHHLAEINPVNFCITQLFWSADNKKVVAIDEHNLKILIGTKNDSYNTKKERIWDGITIYDVSDIIRTEIIEDGEIITGSSFGNALIGGAVLGIGGAVVGSMASSKTNKSKITQLAINMVINDTKEPFFSFPLLAIPSSKNSILYKQGSEKANRINSLLTVLTRRAEIALRPMRESNGTI